MSAAGVSESTVLPSNLGGGPHGLGDPDDKSLRKVEREILIPQKMKEKARKYKCATEVKEFGDCAKEKGLLMPFMCRSLAKSLELCLSKWYKDEDFIKECREEYLEERTFYRQTGIRQKQRKKESSTF
ncbi:COX assembly mitochondrial protein homolog [Liolophura sinensis]|uniref:COX assembly mitochondrial protein homolog n=1 Tax=Liolophura sinensis TaxID=3198878 RepID=UPI0031584E6B